MYDSDLVKLSQNGEVPVNCSCETEIPGLFAAGDVTTVPEKQIVIAAGEGAKASLQAHKYFTEVGGAWNLDRYKNNHEQIVRRGIHLASISGRLEVFMKQYVASLVFQAPPDFRRISLREKYSRWLSAS